MSELKTPGVYVEEITKFPPSVAQVETAIPAFIGYTENVPSKPVQRITSLLEYETLFGKANKEAISLKNTEDKGLTIVTPEVKFLMYYSLQMYFANGGGPCYIVSVGKYTTTGTVELSNLQTGLDLLAIEDEPTLIVFPDATSMVEQEQFYALYQDALTQAEALKDRFVILDTYQGNSVDKTTVDGEDINTITYFRNKINATSYGAAYFPHLKTVLNYTFNEATPITHKGLQLVDLTPQNESFFQEEINALIVLKNDANAVISNTTTTIQTKAKKLGKLLAQAIAIVEKINETADVKVDLTDEESVLNGINGLW
jgi:phage tail sheath protein FI